MFTNSKTSPFLYTNAKYYFSDFFITLFVSVVFLEFLITDCFQPFGLLVIEVALFIVPLPILKEPFDIFQVGEGDDVFFDVVVLISSV